MNNYGNLFQINSNDRFGLKEIGINENNFAYTPLAQANYSHYSNFFQ